MTHLAEGATLFRPTDYRPAAINPKSVNIARVYTSSISSCFMNATLNK